MNYIAGLAIALIIVHGFVNVGMSIYGIIIGSNYLNQADAQQFLDDCAYTLGVWLIVYSVVSIFGCLFTTRSTREKDNDNSVLYFSFKENDNEINLSYGKESKLIGPFLLSWLIYGAVLFFGNYQLGENCAGLDVGPFSIVFQYFFWSMIVWASLIIIISTILCCVTV